MMKQNKTMVAVFAFVAGFGVATVASAAPKAAAAPQWSLVSPKEAAEETSAETSGAYKEPSEVLSKDIFTPIIQVLIPRIDAPTKPPFNVRVEVKPFGNFGVDYKSLKIRYGWMGLDVTARMLQYGKWQGNAFIVSGAVAPAGTHNFKVSIADTAGHRAEADMKVVVLP